jgi:hypothetical protein
MKKIYLFVLASLVVIASCKKDKDEDPDNNTITADVTQLNNGVTTSQYAPYTQGSTFTYQYETIMSTDTATWTVMGGKEFGGKFYVEIAGLMGMTSNAYFNCQNGEYLMYVPATDSTPSMNLIYLKENENIGGTWTQTISGEYMGISVNNKYVFTYAEDLSSYEVYGVTYNDVIHINLDVFVIWMGTEIPAGVEDYYWAQGIGLIEKIGISGNMSLLSYNIE